MKSALSQVAADLRGLPVHFALSAFGPAAVHVVGKAGSPLTWLDVFVHEEDLHALVQELPQHLHARPLWTVWLERQCPLPIDWTWGFQEARRQIFPRQGVYCPSDRLEPTTACAHPDPAVLDARQLGMLAYLYELIGHGQAWSNAAD